LVESRDPGSGQVEWRPVVRLYHTAGREQVAIRIAVGGGEPEEVRATAEHPFWVVGRDWVRARDLRPGDCLLREAGGQARILGVEHLGVQGQTYNLEVEGSHTFFVGMAGVLAHNACQTPSSPGSRGGVTHQETIAGAQEALEAEGWKPAAGGFDLISGRRRPEMLIEQTGSMTRGRRPDLIMTRGREVMAVNVGLENAGGTPVAREGKALQDLRASGRFSRVEWVPYGVRR
jgi:hypothetical protein